jgi:hypothetical protein
VEGVEIERDREKRVENEEGWKCYIGVTFV